jgi:hypothetical protein
MTLTADSISIDTDEGRFVLIVDTEELGKLRFDFHSIALEFEEEVRKELRPYALEAHHARTAVEAGVTLDEYIGRWRDDQIDLARDLARGK